MADVVDIHGDVPPGAGEPIDMQDVVTTICDRLELNPNYVASIRLVPDYAEVKLFCGEEGRFAGPPTDTALFERHPIRTKRRDV